MCKPNGKDHDVTIRREKPRVKLMWGLPAGFTMFAAVLDSPVVTAYLHGGR